MTTIDEKILKKIEDGRQFRRNDLLTDVRTIQDPETGDDSMTIEGHATTFDQEYMLYRYESWNGYDVSVYEKIDRHAFDDADQSDVIFLYDHRGRVMARTRNNTLRVWADDDGLFVRADLSGSSEGPSLYKDIKNGYVDRMSFQFTVDDFVTERTEDTETKTMKVVRTITRVRKLYDVSAVGIPANDGTDISARSAADGVIRELEAERLKEQERSREIEKLKLRVKLERNRGHGNR